jgi:predicted phage tail protein
MSERRLVSGAGGGKSGGGSARAAVEDPDSLRSRQFARVLDAVSEGEIVGLVDSAGNVLDSANLGKGVYLDDTPVQNNDGSFNFQDLTLSTGTFNFAGVTIAANTGTQAQAYLPGFSDVENEVAVSVEVKNSAAVTRSVTNTNLDRIRVTLGYPQLTSQNTTNGDLHGTSVNVQVWVQTYVSGVGGSFVKKVDDTVTGKTTTKYQRAYSITLPKPTNYTGWDIKVVRVTADSTTASLVDKSWWDSYTEIVDVKLRYPNTALVGLSVDASQFSSIPRRAYLLKLIKIQVPTNYDPVTRIYTGVWDGTFKTAWSDNPAWCFYDLVINNRYGLGDFISASQVDKWALYAIAQYCDQLVPSGVGVGGATEPRFRCNLYLQTRADAYKVLNDMASIFRAMLYWGGGMLSPVQDAPSDPVALFTPANVIDGQFQYEGSSRRNRHTAALVTWNDPSDRYQQKIEYVEDAAGIARYGVVKTEVTAFGCTSRGQAHRLGKWILLSELVETETVTFKVGLTNTSVLHPGAVIKVMDTARAGKRWGGHLLSATTTSVTTDGLVDGSPNSLTIETGKTYTISIVLPDGTVQSRTVTNTPGTNVTTLSVGTAFTAAPLSQAMWVLEEASLVAETFRVINVKETNKAEYEIFALSHNPSKYASVEDGLALQTLPITAINPTYQAPVTGLAISEYLYIQSSGIKTMMSVAWNSPVGQGVRYSIKYRADNGNYVLLHETSSTTFDVPDVTPGSYEVHVTAINSLGVRSVETVLTQIIYGKTAPPPDVDIFIVSTELNGTRQFQWAMTAPPLDLGGFKIRWTPGNTGTWSTMTDLHTDLIVWSPYETNQLVRGTYTFAIKAVDTSGNESVNAKFVTVTLGDQNTNSALYSIDERAAGWPGTVNGFFKHWTGVLVPLDQHVASFYTAWEDFNQYVPNPVASANYDSLTHDLAFNDTLRVYSVIQSAPGPGVSGSPNTSFDIDTWLTNANDTNAWSLWTSGTVQLRYLRGRVVEVPGTCPSYISGFTFYADNSGAAKEDNGTVSVIAGGTPIVFNTQFHFAPNLTLSVNASVAKFATYTNLTNTGATLHVWNTSNTDVGTGVGESITWKAKGV